MNFLITGAWGQANEFINWFNKMGHNVVFMQYEKDELPCDYLWVEGIIGNGIFLSHDIEKFKNLKYIQLTSAGYDRVPMSYVKSHNITINNARGVYSIPMAEYAVASVLSLYKKQAFFYDNQRKHIWEKNRNIKELSEETVCILGCGSVGTECAKRFKAMGCTVYGIDISKIDFYDGCYTLDNAEEIFSKVDIVIITLPLTEQTKHMFNRDMFSIMKNQSVIVNISRGAIVEIDALVEALKTKLFGAVLDVFENEPLSECELWDMNNVIITPHNSFCGNNNNKRLSELIKKNLESL